ncbi:MAG: hypothetical protein P8X63_07590, partial [Desulfuromonadaceae bacterium]
ILYGLLATLLAMPLLRRHGIQEELHIDSLSALSGQVGQPLQLTVDGSGFDRQTSFFLALDSGNQQAVINRTETTGDISCILRDENRLYLGSRNKEILLYDISQPRQPAYVNIACSMSNYPMALALSNGTPLAASGFGEFILVNQPDTSGYKSRLATTFTGLASDARGLVYATTAKEGLLVCRPTPLGGAPEKIATLELPGSTQSVAVTGHLACISSNNVGLHICDISDPTRPRLLATLPCPGSNISVAARDRLAFLSSSDRFLVISLEQPEQPRVLAQLPVYQAAHMVIHDQLALLATGSSGLQAIDISDPAHPVIVGHLITGEAILCLSVNSNLAYLGTDNASLLVVDLNLIRQHPAWHPGPVLPSQVKATVDQVLQTRGEMLPEELRAEKSLSDSWSDAAQTGQVSYLTSDSGLTIVDGDVPSLSRVLHTPLASTYRIELVDQTAYICGRKMSSLDQRRQPSGRENQHGLQIFDISDPLRPRAQGFLPSDDWISKMIIREKLAYLAVKGTGVMIVDLEDREQPRALGLVDLPWPEQAFANYKDIYLNGNMLYVANGRVGLQVFDVGVPSRPRRVASFNLPEGWINFLAGNGKQLFVYNFNNELQIYDIEKNPLFPRLIGTLIRFTRLRNIEVRGDRLQIEFPQNFGITQALPLFAEKVELRGSNRAALTCPAPVFPGNYFLYARNARGQKKFPGSIRIAASQK